MIIRVKVGVRNVEHVRDIAESQGITDTSLFDSCSTNCFTADSLLSLSNHKVTYKIQIHFYMAKLTVLSTKVPLIYFIISLQITSI